VAVTLRNDLPNMSFAVGIDALPWTSTVLYTRLHLVKAEPRHPIEFPWSAGFHSSLSAVGVDGI
jgi:hypothetical protein